MRGTRPDRPSGCPTEAPRRRISWPYDGVNAIFFRQESKGSAIASNYTWWDGGNHLVDSDIVFWDYGRVFFTGTSGCTSGAYIEDVAAHELGHGIGLDHSSIADATMYSGYGSCSQALRTLAADDIAGAKALYPGGTSSTTNSAPTITISSPANGASYAQGVSVSFNGSAFDSQDGNLTSTMQWTDNGTAIGAGGLLSRVLTVGTHSIVAYANDSGGLQGKKTISVTVAASTTSTAFDQHQHPEADRPWPEAEGVAGGGPVVDRRLRRNRGRRVSQRSEVAEDAERRHPH